MFWNLAVYNVSRADMAWTLNRPTGRRLANSPMPWQQPSGFSRAFEKLMPHSHYRHSQAMYDWTGMYLIRFALCVKYFLRTFLHSNTVVLETCNFPSHPAKRYLVHVENNITTDPKPFASSQLVTVTNSYINFFSCRGWVFYLDKILLAHIISIFKTLITDKF